MNAPSITLTLPLDLYDRAQRIAEASAQPIESVLLRQIEQALNDPLADLLPEEQDELHALTYLSDDALWTIAREKMPLERQAQMQLLMDKNNFGTISEEERIQLNQLVEQGQKLMLRKGQAGVLLTQRGYKVTPQEMNE